MESPFDKKGWEIRLVVKRKTLKKVNLPSVNGWFYIRFSNGKLFLGNRKVNVVDFSPKRLYISAGFPGKVEVDYLYSLSDYKEVVLRR